MLQVGRQAPQFSFDALVEDQFKTVSQADYRGKWLVLFFYPADFTFICPTEIIEYSKRCQEFTNLNARILGGSTDSVYAHKAWLKQLGRINYPLFSDLTHRISRDYGVLMEEVGQSLRGTFIIDPEGVLKYQLVHHNSVGRSVGETLRVLKGLQTGELCPVEWQPGGQTLGKA